MSGSCWPRASRLSTHASGTMASLNLRTRKHTWGSCRVLVTHPHRDLTQLLCNPGHRDRGFGRARLRGREPCLWVPGLGDTWLSAKPFFRQVLTPCSSSGLESGSLFTLSCVSCLRTLLIFVSPIVWRFLALARAASLTRRPPKFSILFPGLGQL